MGKALFITGTGTDIGKTYVTGLIVKKLRDFGRATTRRHSREQRPSRMARCCRGMRSMWCTLRDLRRRMPPSPTSTAMPYRLISPRRSKGVRWISARWSRTTVRRRNTQII